VPGRGRFSAVIKLDVHLMRRTSSARRTRDAALPAWIKPQLCQLVKEAPSSDDWAHELKFDGYRMHARLDDGDIHLLTRTGLDWTDKYPAIVTALRKLPARQAYLDGELCGVQANGVTSFALVQNAAERQGGAGLVYFVFDLLHLDGRNLMPLPLAKRKAPLAALLNHA
jgi:bifunctional non-homologous end joining protein LigD